LYKVTKDNITYMGFSRSHYHPQTSISSTDLELISRYDIKVEDC